MVSSECSLYVTMKNKKDIEIEMLNTKKKMLILQIESIDLQISELKGESAKVTIPVPSVNP